MFRYYVVYVMRRLDTAQTEITAGNVQYMQLELFLVACFICGLS